MHEHEGEMRDTQRTQYTNADEIARILATGSDDERVALRSFHGWTEEQVRRFVHYAQLRSETRRAMDEARTRRVAEQPLATSEECSLGAYAESLEPQVRDGLFALHRKGYAIHGVPDFTTSTRSALIFRNRTWRTSHFPRTLNLRFMLAAFISVLRRQPSHFLRNAI